MYFQRKIIGVVDGIQINFIDVVYWMCVWVEKIRRTIQENAKQGIKVEFVQFVKTIGLDWVPMDAHYVLMILFFTTF